MPETISVYLEDDVARVIGMLCEQEHRSRSNMASLLILEALRARKVIK